MTKFQYFNFLFYHFTAIRAIISFPARIRAATSWCLSVKDVWTFSHLLLSSSIISARNIRRSRRTTKLQKLLNEFQSLHLRNEVEVTRHQRVRVSICVKSVASHTRSRLISGNTCASIKELNRLYVPSKTAIASSQFVRISTITFESATREKGNNSDPDLLFIHMFTFQTIPVHNLRQEIPHWVSVLPASINSSWRATLWLWRVWKAILSCRCA